MRTLVAFHCLQLWPAFFGGRPGLPGPAISLHPDRIECIKHSMEACFYAPAILGLFANMYPERTYLD